MNTLRSCIRRFACRRPPTVIVDAADCDMFANNYRIIDVARMFAIMTTTPTTTFHVTTTHPGRARGLLRSTHFWWRVDSFAADSPAIAADAVTDRVGQRLLPNLCLGVVADTQLHMLTRVPRLLETPASTRFLDVRPLREPLNLREVCPPHSAPADAPALDWVVAGHDSDRSLRSEDEWVQSLHQQCGEVGVQFRLDEADGGGDVRHVEHRWELPDPVAAGGMRRE